MPTREELLRALRYPLTSASQNSLATTYLLARRCKIEPLPPLAFEQAPSGGVRPALHTLCPSGQLPRYSQAVDLLFLWKEAGYLQEADKLAQWLLAFGHPPFTIGYSESEYLFQEQVEAAQRLHAAYGEPSSSFTDPSFRMVRSTRAFFTLMGWKSPIGSIDFEDDLSIRAFGPEELPLQGASSFGLSWVQGPGPKDILETSGDQARLKGWSATYPSQIWIEMDLKASANSGALSLRFREPLLQRMAFSFYLKADRCQVGTLVLAPRSLQRYQGEAQTIFMEGQKERMQICASVPSMIQLIPLAGKGAFWDTDFLVAFEVPQRSESIHFEIGYR